MRTCAIGATVATAGGSGAARQKRAVELAAALDVVQATSWSAQGS